MRERDIKEEIRGKRYSLGGCGVDRNLVSLFELLIEVVGSFF